METLDTKSEHPIARPLSKLVPLIKADLDKLNIEITRTQELRTAIGEKLIEAKTRLDYGHFGDWISRNFKMSRASATEYMRMVKAERAGNTKFASVQDFRRRTHKAYHHNPTGTSRWRNDVQAHLNNVKPSEFEVKAERDREVHAKNVNKLAVEIISIGYKVLATKLHPDKGGSVEAMQHLNEARDQLRRCVE